MALILRIYIYKLTNKENKTTTKKYSDNKMFGIHKLNYKWIPKLLSYLYEIILRIKFSFSPLIQLCVITEDACVWCLFVWHLSMMMHEAGVIVSYTCVFLHTHMTRLWTDRPDQVQTETMCIFSFFIFCIITYIFLVVHAETASLSSVGHRRENIGGPCGYFINIIINVIKYIQLHTKINLTKSQYFYVRAILCSHTRDK